MDQIANLVIDLSIDSAEFRNEVPRIKKLLNDAAGDSERSAARMQRFLDKQTEATRRTSASLEQVTASSTAYSSAVEKSAAASTRLAADVDQTRQRVEALGRKLREEQAQSAAVAAAQDRTSAAFYRQIDSVKQLSGGLQELQRIQAQVRQAKGRGDISQGDYLALVSETARKTRELTDAEALATQKKAQFIRRLKEQTTVQGLSRTELLRVKAAELGVSSAADIYIRKLERTGTATHTLGLKSAAARRELGVLAGELARGNFGALRGSGITLANRAGWIEQLMSPKGMMLGGLAGGVAAAVYGLGKAYYEGAKESETFNKQLILTGSYAGKTTGQLNAMAKSLAGNGVTQHDAAGVLAQVVGSGAFTGQAVAMVSRTATRMQENVGQSVDETIRQFKRLRDDPVNAAKELDRTLHFLTSTQLEQIRVLGEQGRVADAAKIAMSAYSEEMNKRMGDVHDNLGWIERAWNAVGDAAKWAWDRMLDDALGNDPNFATTVLNKLAGKQPLDDTLTALSGKSVDGLIEYVGLRETINRAAGALQKDQNGADIPDKKQFARTIGAVTSTSVTFGESGWFKIATVFMPQATSTAVIKLYGGSGFNVGSFEQAAISELVLRAGNGSPVGITATLWRRSPAAANEIAWINTSGDSYDIYINIGRYAYGLIAQYDCTSNAGVILHTSPEFSETKPANATNGQTYTLFNSLMKPTAGDVEALSVSGGRLNGPLGIGTDNALGGNSIVFGDNDTGLKQNGDGILDIFANNQHTVRVAPGEMIVLGAIRAGNGKKLSLTSTNNSALNAGFNLWGDGGNRPTVIELGDDQGWHLYSQRNTDGSIQFVVNGQVIPDNYGNFDARYLSSGNVYTKGESDNRYVQNIQRGAPVWPGKVDEYGPNEAPAGCFLTQARHDPTTAYGVTFAYRPLQMWVGNGWRTING
ncbi:shikimate transporter [Salmonella enterica subsp. enterica]|nr:shikimate transporter [Salmonella enterica]ECH9343112.1 shikimate transporter [Salmonella enterica subsp. enterica]EDQ6228155.1 shikimate transporter [Salmonella enterica subsp. enterica serovar Tucson]EDR6856290.1 shikimate transporter [Salmonella enterica subsp. enterica]EDU3652108.1 shikimate transporter [Salmonella enterica subsp. enterica serovar Tucson]